MKNGKKVYRNDIKNIPKRVLLSSLVALTLHTGASFIDNCYLYNLSRRILPDIDSIQKNNYILYGGEKVTLTESELEKKFNVELKGSDDPGQMQAVAFALSALNAKGIDYSNAVDQIILQPDYLNPNKSGRAYAFNTVVLGPKTDIETVIHEVGHTITFDLPSSFWKEWDAVKPGSHKHSRYGVWGYLDGSKSDSAYIPNDGCITEYARLNSFEDTAELFEATAFFTHPLTVIHPDEKLYFERKIKLFEKYGVYSEEHAHNIIASISTHNPVYALDQFAQVVKNPPQVSRIESSDETLSVQLAEVGNYNLSYNSGMRGNFLSITLDSDRSDLLWSQTFTRGDDLQFTNPVLTDMKENGYFDSSFGTLMTIRTQADKERVFTDGFEINGPVEFVSSSSEIEDKTLYYFHNFKK